MMFFKRLPLFVAPFVLFACSEAKFTGTPSAKATQDQPSDTSTDPGTNPENPTDGTTDPTNPTNNPTDPTNPSNPTDPTNPTTPTTPETPTTPCSPTEQSIGAELAFLIDNSNSNAATDCPSPTKVARVGGVDLYECQGETNREKAVLAAYDLLSAVAKNEPGNAKAKSDLSIASFPTSNDYVNGHQVQAGGWLDSSSAARADVASAMLFARKPSGLTPYGAALEGGSELFAQAASDGRAKVAVLVTDGEPTDQDPSGVLAKAEALKQAGVTIITVFVTNSEARASREAKHTEMLRKIVESTNGDWFDRSEFPKFADYMTALLGSQTKKSLIAKISAKVVEVDNSAALKDAFLSIIKTQVIACEQ